MPIRDNIRRMAGYTPGEQLNDPSIIKLNTNENPYPPSPRVFEAIRSALTSDNLRKYPQPLGDTFRHAAAKIFNLSPDSILIGNGSDDLLTIITRAFVPEGGVIVSPTPSYVLYKSLAEIQNAQFQTVRFNEDWSLPQPWPIQNADLMFFPNPNSPSGTGLKLKELSALTEQIEGPLVIDEAYADFAEQNALELAGKLPNVILTRSFSKYYSLAGIRFGFAISTPEIVAELVKVKDSYNCDAIALAAATAAIQDQDYYAGVREQILATRRWMFTELSNLGFQVTPSQANFLWCRRTDRPVKPIYEALKERKILVRYMNYANFGDGLRISVGTPKEVETLLGELRGILAS